MGDTFGSLSSPGLRLSGPSQYSRACGPAASGRGRSVKRGCARPRPAGFLLLRFVFSGCIL